MPKQTTPKLAIAGAIDQGKRVLLAAPLIKGSHHPADAKKLIKVPTGLSVQRVRAGYILRLKGAGDEGEVTAVCTVIRGKDVLIDIEITPAADGVRAAENTDGGDVLEDSTESAAMDDDASRQDLTVPSAGVVDPNDVF